MLDMTMPATDCAADYSCRVQPLTEATALITSDMLGAVVVPSRLCSGVNGWLRANALTGPVIRLPGSEAGEIHLVTGMANGRLAAAAMANCGVTVYRNGTLVPLPETPVVAGRAQWALHPDHAHWIPPLVALGAAVRAVTTTRRAVLTS